MAPRRLLTAGVVFAPVPALGLGIVTMRGGGIPASVWLQNVAAALGGLLIVWAASAAPARWSRNRFLQAALLSGVLLLCCTLMVPGVEGVHRWLPAGPVRVHAGAALLPPMLIALWEAPWSAACGTAFATLILLVLQPDAAQAASFCAAWIWVAAARRDRSVGVVMMASLLIAGAALFRPDPLQPVAHVEGIVGMAASQSAVLAGSSLLALAVLALAPALLLERRRGIALAVYIAGTLVAAWLGDFPVPVMGYGVSPILGYYGAVAMYIFLGRPSPVSSTEAPAAV